MAFNPNYLVGKTIERVTMNPPMIHFTDGSSIYFVFDETDNLQPVEIVYVPKPRRPK